MNELGILIDQKGQYMSFGKWKIRSERYVHNVDDWHNDSFKEYVYNTEWFQSLGVPYDLEKDFHNQLDVFAKSGIVSIVNNREQIEAGSIVLTTPDTITDEQIQVLLSMKDSLINFENGDISFIDVFDVNEEYSILESFFHISDYYDYLDKIIEDRNSKKK